MKKSGTQVTRISFIFLLLAGVLFLFDNKGGKSNQYIIICLIAFVVLLVIGLVISYMAENKNENTLNKLLNSPEYQREKAIYEYMTSVQSGKVPDGNKLISMGAFMALTRQSNVTGSFYSTALTEQMSLTQSSVGGGAATYSLLKDQPMIACVKIPVVSQTTATKNASVTGRAVAGAVIGGTTGALIGAASAIETNNAGGIQKTYTNQEGYMYLLSCDEAGSFITSVYLRTDLYDRLDNETKELFENTFQVFKKADSVFIRLLFTGKSAVLDEDVRLQKATGNKSAMETVAKTLSEIIQSVENNVA